MIVCIEKREKILLQMLILFLGAFMFLTLIRSIEMQDDDKKLAEDARTVLKILKDNGVEL